MDTSKVGQGRQYAEPVNEYDAKAGKYMDPLPAMATEAKLPTQQMPMAAAHAESAGSATIDSSQSMLLADCVTICRNTSSGICQPCWLRTSVSHTWGPIP